MAFPKVCVTPPEVQELQRTRNAHLKRISVSEHVLASIMKSISKKSRMIMAATMGRRGSKGWEDSRDCQTVGKQFGSTLDAHEDGLAEQLQQRRLSIVKQCVDRNVEEENESRREAGDKSLPWAEIGKADADYLASILEYDQKDKGTTKKRRKKKRHTTRLGPEDIEAAAKAAMEEERLLEEEALKRTEEISGGDSGSTRSLPLLHTPIIAVEECDSSPSSGGASRTTSEEGSYFGTFESFATSYHTSYTHMEAEALGIGAYDVVSDLAVEDSDDNLLDVEKVEDIRAYAYGVPYHDVNLPNGNVSDDEHGEVALMEFSDEENNVEEKIKMEKGELNMRFQEIMEKIQGLAHNSPVDLQISAYTELIGLAQDFLFFATTYGKIIISEVYLDDEAKTIKPIKLGGVAGGSKYIVHDILFKFALDTEGIYGGDNAAAAKVAGHELKGLQGFFNCSLPALSLPLICLVDYRGFRLIAESLLPIDRDTLIYGSCDCGRTVKTDMVFEALMKRASTMLNIAPHRGGIIPTQRKLLYTATDIEGHLGSDGRYYLLDLARTFPPEKPRVLKPGVNLANLLRPEMVKRFREPLCPDAYSNFAAKSYNSAIDAATEYLEELAVPGLAMSLPSLIEDAKDKVGFRLTEALHSKGINIRYLGLVFTNVMRTPGDVTLAMARILLEMVGRVIKSDMQARLRDKMKEVGKPLEDPYRTMVVDFLNLLFGSTAESRSYWSENIYDMIIAKFPLLYFEGELSRDSPHMASEGDSGQDDVYSFDFKAAVLSLIGVLSDQDPNWVIIQTVQHMTGLAFVPFAERQLTKDNGALLKQETPFSPLHLRAIGVKVKHMNIVGHAEGFIYMVQGFTMRAFDPEGAVSYLEQAIAKFEDVLNTNTNSKITLRQCARTLLAIDDEVRRMKRRKIATEAKEKEEKKSSKKKRNSSLGDTAEETEDLNSMGLTRRVERARQYYKRAIEADPQDPETLFQFAKLFQYVQHTQDAEEYFLQALECDPNHVDALRAYGSFLDSQGLHREAELFYDRMLKVQTKIAALARSVKKDGAGEARERLRRSTLSAPLSTGTPRRNQAPKKVKKRKKPLVIETLFEQPGES